ncbi:MAG: NERD domain-containing protein [Acholeplasmataceae bacterium]
MNPAQIVILIVIFISLFIFIITLIVSSKRPTISGNYGERRVIRIIYKYIIFYKRYKNNPDTDLKYNFNDLMVSYKNKTSQIDHIIISKKGVFVVETKNSGGRVYGNEESYRWTQVLAHGNVKHEFYNPIRQNKSHIYALSKILNRNDCFHSVIVFPRAYLFVESNTPVGNLDIIVKEYYNKPDILTNNEINEIYNKLLYFKENPPATLKEHVDSIKETKRLVDENICPRCRSSLIIREGKNGYFYGCKNFPQCRFTKDID